MQTEADVRKYWAQFDTPLKAVKSALVSLAAFNAMPEQRIDQIAKTVVGDRNTRAKWDALDSPRETVRAALLEEFGPFSTMIPGFLGGSVDWIVGSLRLSGHLS